MSELPGAIDLMLIAGLMRTLEAGIHRHGWAERGGRMQLFVLHEPEITGPTYANMFRPIVRRGPYTIGRMLSPRVFEDSSHSAPELLRFLALQFAYPNEDDPEIQEMRERVSIAGVIGFMSTFEAWTASLTFEEMEADPGRYVGDIDGAETARVVMCVDAWDRCHVLTRRKGYKPTVSLDGPMRGDVSTSLRVLMDMVYGRTPPRDRFDQHYPLLLDAARSAVRSQGDGLPPDPFPVSDHPEGGSDS